MLYFVLLFFRGWQGMLAYGCQDVVVVVDPNTVQIIQTLDKHKAYIVKVYTFLHFINLGMN